METKTTESDIFHDKVAKIEATRNILRHVKTWHTVSRMPHLQLADRMKHEAAVTDLCDAGLIRYFGDAKYSITMKGLRFLDAIELFDQANQSSGLAARPSAEMA